MFDIDTFRLAQERHAEAVEIQRQLQPALDYAREAAAQIADYERSLPAGLEDMVRDQTASLHSILADLVVERPIYIPPIPRRSGIDELQGRTEELRNRIGELERLLDERLPDPNAPVPPFPHKRTGFHAGE